MRLHPWQCTLLFVAILASVIPSLGLVIVLSLAIRQLQVDPHLMAWNELLGEHVSRWLTPYLRDTPLEQGVSAELQIAWLPILLLGVGLAHAVLRALIEFLIENLGERVSAKSRELVIESFLRQDFHQATQVDPALLASMVGPDSRELKFGVRRILGLIPMNLLQSFVLLSWLVILDTSLFALFVAVLIPAGITIRMLGKTLKRLARRGLKNQTEVLGLFMERLSGWETIRVFGTRLEELKKFRAKNQDLYKNMRRSARARALGAPTVEWLATIAAALVVIIALRRLSVGTLSDSVLTGFLVTIAHLSGTLQTLTKHLQSIKRTHAAMDRINAFAKRSMSLTDPHYAEECAPLQAAPSAEKFKVSSLNAQNLAVSRSGKRDILLQGININLSVGDFLAITGESGAGKSTLLRVLLGIEPPAKGTILINGKKPGTPLLPWSQVASDLVLLSQEPFLCHGSVYENILYPFDLDWQPNTEKIERALKCLQNAGLNKDLSTAAKQLSGGEKQRLMLARAFYRDATLWVLDESTSALDAETESSFLQLLRDQAADHMVIFVTHRKSVVAFANQHLHLQKNDNIGEPHEPNSIGPHQR